MIQFINVWKSYSQEMFKTTPIALQAISFSMERGQTLGMIGANGAGKSTCIKLLMDFIRPDRGTISLFDSTPGDHRIRKRIGYLPETANFSPNLTALNLLDFTGTTCGLSKKAIRIGSEKWLRHLALWEDRKRPLRNYSKGMQQRANFAIALLNDPDLLILDEPMSGLDPIGRADIFTLISDLKAQGKTILFCSHILEDVDRLVDNVLVLHKGRKLFEGTPRTLATQQDSANFVEGYLSLVQGETHNG